MPKVKMRVMFIISLWVKGNPLIARCFDTVCFSQYALLSAPEYVAKPVLPSDWIFLKLLIALNICNL
jgi:hypothetical protein